ncbi:MAG: hypothetical protein CMA81_07500 [Euryarchaeota archaeon]|nr:hypothetical protein [Euryarchaeota archaeon]
MHSRVVIRSLVLPDGYIAAMDDGMISWRPNVGIRRNIKLEFPISTILAVGGANGKCDSIWCGDTRGNISQLSLPMLSVLKKFCLNSSSIRAICAVSSSSDKILAGTSDGEIWALGKEIPGGSIRLFSIGSAITSMKCSDENIIIQSGWSRYTFDWTGNEIDHHDHNKIFISKKIKRDNRRSKLLKFQIDNGNLPESVLLDLPVVA